MPHLPHQVGLLRTVVVAAALALAGAGCGRLARTILDLPPPAAPRSAAARPAPATEAAAPIAAPRERAPLELVRDRDSVLAKLPRDHAGNADWVAAQRAGLLRPLPAHDATPGAAEPGFVFAFDFFLPGPDSTFDAFFPHSAHTALIDCRHCHGRIFRYRDQQMRMSEILGERKWCGECHGTVAFPAARACERCHPALKLAPNRESPELIGDIVMRRVTEDPRVPTATPEEQLPPARFPHWVHRIRFQCRACHPAPFEPAAGANRIVMKDINEGRFCGRCHDGRTAFRAGFGNCDRCHRPEASAAATAP